MAAKRGEIAGLRQLAVTGELVHACGGLIHGLQRERGLSNLYLASRAQQGAQELAHQVEEGLALEAATRAAFERLDPAHAASAPHARLFGRVAYALQGLHALPALRQRVREARWSPAEATAAYVRLIGALLAVVFEAADAAADPAVARHLVALFHFMQGKEWAGQERATGAALFAGGRSEHEAQQRLLHLIDSQDRCLQVFHDFADEPLRQAWETAPRPQTLAVLERMRRVLGTAPSGAPLEPSQSQLWFDTCTARLDAMRTVESRMTETLLSLCAGRLQAAEAELEACRRWQAQAGTEPRAEDLMGFFDERAPTPDAPPSARPPDTQAYGPQLERSILSLVQEQAQRLQAMGDELATTRASLHERKLIERAKGLLMAHRGLGEEEAHKTLRQMAMNQNRRLVEVAKAVLTTAQVLPPRRT